MNKKSALITGASEGLGRAFTVELAKQGYHTVAVARNESRLASLCEELKNQNPSGDFEYIAADLSSTEGIQACITSIKNQQYDLVINNAGLSTFGRFEDSDIQSESNILSVNCLSLMQISHAFLEKARPGDSLINLSSITFRLPTPIQPTYVASKSFIASFSESLWFQQKEKGVYVQGLCPGLTKTEFLNRAGDLDEGKKKFLDMISQTPEQVVQTSLKAMDNKKGPLIVPGLSNKIMMFVLKLIPRKPLVWLMGKVNNLAM